MSGGCWVNSGSLGSFGSTQAVVGLIRGHWIHLGWPCASCVHSGTLGPFGFALVEFGGHWVHLGAPWVSFGYSGSLV